ncbi:secreted RxLR effector protein 161-like [Phaseolus vulgaris]|uniref:secreted RxLR effector protein 161-like n=1 Tax=Phaseolus vulgaris TaxID=3885 RepID=UPI0035C9B388
MGTPINQKEKLVKEDGSPKVDEAEFRSLIGCLMYLTATIPDILNAVSILSRFMHCPNETHMRVAKRLIRYIKGTLNFGVKFLKHKVFKLSGFSDRDWGGSIDDMKITSGSKMFLWSLKEARNSSIHC